MRPTVGGTLEENLPRLPMSSSRSPSIGLRPERRMLEPEVRLGTQHREDFQSEDEDGEDENDKCEGHGKRQLRMKDWL